MIGTPTKHIEQESMSTPITTPPTQELLSPLLSSLPAAAVSPEPPAALLPLLSPILRQRVKLLSGSSSDPWLSLLCYDSAQLDRLKQIAQNDRLEPHPVSGEVEVDWESEVALRYKRLDEETLHAFAGLQELDLDVKLVWCTGDAEGGPDGWRIGEVTALNGAVVDASKGSKTIADAEDVFESQGPAQPATTGTNDHNANEEEDEEDDDDYWAQYDNTSSAQTPARSPAPDRHEASNGTATNDEEYYAQYGNVQPAMDNHDPDEERENGDVESTLGDSELASKIRREMDGHPELSSSSLVWDMPSNDFKDPPYPHDSSHDIAQPRAVSPGSSSGGDMVDKLEKSAAGASDSQSEIAIKQHISMSVKSLFRLARAGGIDREEFKRQIRTELDCLEILEADD